MICSSINSTFDINLYPKEIKDAIDFFKATDFNALDPG
jgi:beta-galactosidase beta subunit